VSNTKESRERVLLRAAYDLLTKAAREHYISQATAIATFYDGTMCDGFCLREDIAAELGIDEDTDPLMEGGAK
jgi:hypothetical protein